MHFGDIKQSIVSLGQTWDSKPVGAGLQGPLVFTRGGNPYASHHQTVPAHCTQNIVSTTLLQIDVNALGFIYVKALVNTLWEFLINGLKL